MLDSTATNPRLVNTGCPLSLPFLIPNDSNPLPSLPFPSNRFQPKKPNDKECRICICTISLLLPCVSIYYVYYDDDDKSIFRPEARYRSERYG